MRFLVDNQLPPALARLIEFDFGTEASHVRDVGLRDACDAEVWAYATSTGYTVISKDEDFVRMVLNASTAGFGWVRVGTCRREVLLNVFRRVWPRIIERLESGDRFIEVR